jgi:hypothetical protein
LWERFLSATFNDGCRNKPVWALEKTGLFRPTWRLSQTMKIEFLDNWSDDGLLIIVNELPGYIAVDCCNLAMFVGNVDKGIRKLTDETKDFEWIMTRSSWDDLADLAEPFYNYSGHQYQWLAGHEVAMANLARSEIALLISTYPDGQW